MLTQHRNFLSFFRCQDKVFQRETKYSFRIKNEDYRKIDDDLIFSERVQKIMLHHNPSQAQTIKKVCRAKALAGVACADAACLRERSMLFIMAVVLIITSS